MLSMKEKNDWNKNSKILTQSFHTQWQPSLKLEKKLALLKRFQQAALYESTVQ